MNITGLQKLTLLDFPERIACTVFIYGCNLRCPFCHNASLVVTNSQEDHISEDELIAFLQSRKGLLDGVCITGGEPTMYGDELRALIQKIRGLGFAVKLDTNGTNPSLLTELINEGLLDYVAMDIKNSPTNIPPRNLKTPSKLSLSKPAITSPAKGESTRTAPSIGSIILPVALNSCLINFPSI